MNPAYSRTGHGGRATGSWLPVLVWALISAVLTLLIVWWLLPGTPSAGSVAQAAVSAVTSSSPAGPGPAPDADGAALAGRVAAAIPPGSHVIIGLPVTSRFVDGPVTVLPEGTIPDAAETPDAAATAPVTDAGMAMAFDPDGTWVIAATSPSSSVPAVCAAALLAALAALGSALLGRHRMSHSAAPLALPAEPAITLSGTERIASSELSQLRLDAQQRTLLARRLAELLPSLPEAVVWQAEKALAEVGVRTVVPDGEPFDPAVHYAVGTEAVPAHGAENTIARTVRPGYSDDESILVYPKVVVYADAGSQPDDGSRP